MDPSTEGGLSVPVTQEQLHVHRETVDTGRPLRLRKEVHEVPAFVREPLEVEAVQVERVPIGRVIDELPAMRQEGDVTIAPVIEERLVTRTELVLVEEIRLTRQRKVVHVEAEVTLRRERVEVERFDPGSGQWHSDPEGEDDAAQSHPHRSP